MRWLLTVGVFLVTVGCGQLPPRATTVETSSPGGQTIKMVNDANTKVAPNVENNTDDVVINAPPGTKVTVSEFLPAKADSPSSEAKRTTMEFPSNAGGEIKIKKTELKAHGSAGHEPPPPETSFEKSLSYWSYIGILMFAVGIFFCTPWGGKNIRVGALIAAGGLTMSILGLFLNELSQWAKYKMPDWLPAVGFLGLLAAIVLYWGYRLRHKQEQQPEPLAK